MLLTPGVVNNPAIENLIQSSLESKHKLEWIPCSLITDITSSSMDNIYHAKSYQGGEYCLEVTKNAHKRL